MSLFSTSASGGQGAGFFQPAGMDAVMRKGGTGVMPVHAAVSKSASIRIMQDGFNIKNASNVDLILRRKAPPSTESMRQNSAGALPSERRGPDFPAVVRHTSVEHIVHRRHSAPPARHQRGQENMMMQLATVNADAKRIGRSSKGCQRSRSPNRSSSPSQSPRAGSPRRARSQSPRKSTLPVFMPEPSVACQSSSSCTWGEAHAFDAIQTYVEINREEADIMYNENAEFEKAGSLKARSYSGWASDDGRSTATGGSSPGTLSTFSSSSFFSECPTPTSMYSDLVDGTVKLQRCQEMYERRMKALVKAQQKKAMSKVRR